MTDAKKPNLLLTRYGVVVNNGDLQHLDRDEFLKWTRDNRGKYKNREDMLEEDWIVEYKLFLSRAYAGRYYKLSERIP